MEICFFIGLMYNNKKEEEKIMKKVKGLIIYTAVVIGGSFLFRHSQWLENFLFLGIVSLGLVIIVLLNTGIVFDTDRNEANLQTDYRGKMKEKQKKINAMSYGTIFTYLYLLVPFLIAMSLFVR